MTPRVLSKDSAWWRGLVSQHWAILLVVCIATIPFFADLGEDYLWSDEGDTAVLALSILKNGVPNAWDGKTFTDSDYGARLNKDLLMVSHPWLQYYLTAGSFVVFGKTPFAARFPFAVAGFLTIPLLYVLVLRLTSDKRAALVAAILLLLSVQFLLFSRQARNYALSGFLTCLVLVLFFELKDRRSCIWFAVVAVLDFHSLPSAVAPLGAMGLLTFLKPFGQYRRWFWTAAPFIAVLTGPWIIMARSGYEVNTTPVPDILTFVARLDQFLIESASVAPVLGVIVLFIVLWVQRYRLFKSQSKPKAKNPPKGLLASVSEQIFTPGERMLVLAAGMVLVFYAVLIAFSQARGELFTTGLRYAVPVMPLTLVLVAILVSKVSGTNSKWCIALTVLLATTNLGLITPWAFHDEQPSFEREEFVALHVPKGQVNRYLNTALVGFCRELFQDNPGTVAAITSFLKTNAAPDDILILNYGWEPVYFHTQLRQGLKVMPEYPIYPAARRHNLPEYVFSVENARWLIWRWPWDTYRGYDWKKVTDALVEKGARLTPVASVPETIWENRANLHYHRFPGKDYIYGWYSEQICHNADILRIDWPAARTNSAPPEATSPNIKVSPSN